MKKSSCEKTFLFGFLFSPDLSKVIILNNEGVLKAIGGEFKTGGMSINDGFDINDLMTEIFCNEAGLTVPEWKLFHKAENFKSVSYFLKASTPNFYKIETMTNKEILIMEVDQINQYVFLDQNLRWLIPMATDSEHFYSESASILIN